MIIKTIIYDAVGFYISPHRWNDANFAFRADRHNGWQWIGSPGWYCTEDNKQIYDKLATTVDMVHWHEGEFAEVNIEI